MATNEIAFEFITNTLYLWFREPKHANYLRVTTQKYVMKIYLDNEETRYLTISSAMFTIATDCRPRHPG